MTLIVSADSKSVRNLLVLFFVRFALRLVERQKNAIIVTSYSAKDASKTGFNSTRTAHAVTRI